MQTKYIAIDSNLGRNEEDLAILKRILTNGAFDDKKVLLLQFSNSNKKVKSLLESTPDLEVAELENKAGSADIKLIFHHFSSIENRSLNSIKSKITFGKKILYLDAVSNSFIRKFESNNECPGFWNLPIGTFCRHGCSYCFLNLTMRMRPLCVEHLNLSQLRRNLKNFNRKNSINTLLNAGETSDPLDNEPILHLWNDIVEIVQESSNQILCLTKSRNVKSILEPDGNNLAHSVIYSWSMNPSSVVHRFEPNTASTQERLDAACHLKNLGYKIRFRVDPILPLNLMEAICKGEEISPSDTELEDYFNLIDNFAKIEPEMVTFGTFRALPPLFNFLTDKIFEKKQFIKNGKRFRIPKKYRHYIYEKLGLYTQDILGCHISICKDPSINLPFSTLKVPCNCLKIKS